MLRLLHRRFLIPLVGLLASLVLMTSLAAMGYLMSHRNDQIVRNCQSMNALRGDFKSFLIEVIVKADRRLSQLEYYQTRPRELAEARAANAEAMSAVRRKFRPLPCG